MSGENETDPGIVEAPVGNVNKPAEDVKDSTNNDGSPHNEANGHEKQETAEENTEKVTEITTEVNEEPNLKNDVSHVPQSSADTQSSADNTPSISTPSPSDLPSEDKTVSHNRQSSSETQSPRSVSVRSSHLRGSSRSASISSVSSTSHAVPAIVFMKKAVEAIKSSKEARKISALENSLAKVVKHFDSDPNALPAPATIVQPLKIVCTQTKNNDLKVVALDCIGKLFTFSYLEDDPMPIPAPGSEIRTPPTVPLVDQVVATVCECYDAERTDPRVELQIIKALMAAVLNEDLVCHGATLLKALRQTYNVFVLSHSGPNQTIAQATLTQMVNVVFDRVKNNVLSKSRTNSSVALDGSATPVSTSGPELTLKSMQGRASMEEVDSLAATNESDAPLDLYVKDAFLVFRTMCKLSEKGVDGETQDGKSPATRSKLLSLHLIHTILNAHMSVFTSEDVVVKSNRGDERFVYSVKDYICSSLVRNAATISPAIFEISIEIFWLILSNLRGAFKREIQVFFAEIYFPILEMKTSTFHQKQYLLSVIQRVCNDPRALVEIYLNYDCDRNATLNIYEKIVNVLVKLAVSRVPLTGIQLQQYQENKNKPIAVYSLSLPPALSISNVISHSNHSDSLPYPGEYVLKMMALESTVAVLRSLLAWSQRGIAAVSATLENNKADSSVNGEEHEEETGLPEFDDPSAFESLKQRKTVLSDAIREFNFKPKRGLERLVDEGFIKTREPHEVAEFLATTEGLDKATIGDFLGEGDPYNISIMHEFVNRMDFLNMPFVDALRIFLQGFRLPGEGQKIDRYMLKFAERYISGNPGAFANADTAYVLAYSVIMLNTDLHSPQNKKRMTVEDFIANNRGINDKKDLPREYLENIYEEIQNNEIKLLSEQHAALLSSTGTDASAGFGSSFGLALATVGRDLQREAYMRASKEMTNKTESLFKSLILSNGRREKASADAKGENIFYAASHIEHVKPMFEVGWMSFLAGTTGPFQETEESETISLCLEGIRLSIRISCLFDLEYPRISFVSALAKFTHLQNLSEMKSKNVEVIKILLNIALAEGNILKKSWKDVLVCVSQLERFQLISAGIAAGVIPDVTNARIENRQSGDSSRTNNGVFGGFAFSHNGASASQQALDQYDPEIGEALRSAEIVTTMDKIFTQSASLSGSSIQEFVQALIEVSWEEIQSSGNSESPRLFSLQKMVDVCYYNMDRIRVEWSQLWNIMGENFNRMGCHQNSNIVTFAIDSLRQLSIRFFDIDELPHFKFQKDFLAPFEYVMRNNQDLQAKDIVLQCLKQMILVKSDRIKSGWGAMLNTFGAAGSTDYSSIVNSAFDLVRLIYKDHLDKVIAQDAFGGLASSLGALSKNSKFQKTSLHSLDMLNETIDWIGSSEGQTLIGMADKDDTPDNHEKYWYPIFAALHDVIMNGEDLEVRSRALNYLFDSLVKHGGAFAPDFWDQICRQLLFPIFIVLKRKSTSNVRDDLSVWLSTTMIQALKNMIALLTHYFDTLGRMLEGFLDLLTICIDQDNDTVSRIGSLCFLMLVSDNAEKLNAEHWHLIVDKLDILFVTSSAEELFDEPSSQEIAKNPAENRKNRKGKKSLNNDVVVDVEKEAENGSLHSARFRTAIAKSALQLLMIKTADEMLKNPVVFAKMPTDEILRVTESLRQSYTFAKKFHSDLKLRRALWNQAIMKEMPNLHRQESNAAIGYIGVVMKLYKDKSKHLNDLELESIVNEQMLPFWIDVIDDYNGVDPNDPRRARSLIPVVATILNEYLALDNGDIDRTLRQFYPHIVNILNRDMDPEIRMAVRNTLHRVEKML